MRAAWLTDIHLNFLSPDQRKAFYRQVAAAGADALLVGGDIGEADSVLLLLDEFAVAVQVPIYFVLGNHDFYHGSIEGVRRRVRERCADSAWLHWLPAAGVVQLGSGTALIGHDGWADGRAGDYWGSEVLLNDYVCIRELSGLRKSERLLRLNTLGDEAARCLEEQARLALARARNVFVLTHVPPFRESAWHEGRTSSDDYLPHFACPAAGQRLAVLMSEHPENEMVVLCGHTHGAGEVGILKNLLVLTGGAEYGRPEIQRVFELG